MKHLACYRVVPLDQGAMIRRLAWILAGYRTTSAILTLHIGEIIFTGQTHQEDDLKGFGFSLFVSYESNRILCEFQWVSDRVFLTTGLLKDCCESC